MDEDIPLNDIFLRIRPLRFFQVSVVVQITFRKFWSFYVKDYVVRLHALANTYM